MKTLLAILACVMGLTACEQGSDDKIAQAQACLDNATAANVGTCTAMVAGISGPRADLIRCSSDFIFQGFTGTSFVNAFTALKAKTAGTNSTVGMLTFLIFTTGGSDPVRMAYAATALSDCSGTGMAGMMMFANFSSIATQLSTGLGTLPPTEAQLRANLNAGDSTVIGNSILTIANTYCSGTSSTNNVDFCAAVNDAASTGTATGAAARMRTLLGITQ